jgi:hypothetical protein
MEREIQDLMRRVMLNGDVGELLALVSMLARAGRAAEIADIVGKFLKLFPGEAANLASKLPMLHPEARGQVQLVLNAIGRSWRNRAGDLLKFAGRALTGFARIATKGFTMLAKFLGRMLGLSPAMATVIAAVVLAMVVVAVVALILHFWSRPTENDIVFCDCSRTEAGLLTQQYQEQCFGTESNLRRLAKGCRGIGCVVEKLRLTTAADGTLNGGDFCDSVTAGPFAWPIFGAPGTPPPHPPELPACESVSGLSLSCR